MTEFMKAALWSILLFEPRKSKQQICNDSSPNRVTYFISFTNANDKQQTLLPKRHKTVLQNIYFHRTSSFFLKLNHYSGASCTFVLFCIISAVICAVGTPEMTRLPLFHRTTHNSAESTLLDTMQNENAKHKLFFKPRVFTKQQPQATCSTKQKPQASCSTNAKQTTAARFARQQEFFSCTLSDLEGDGHFPSPFDRSPYAHTREQMCHTLHFGDFQYNNKKKCVAS